MLSMVTGVKKEKYRVLSLFSGGLGLDLGLESTGRFEIVICIEKVGTFCDTIRDNIARGRLSRDTHVIEADISLLNPTDLFSDLKIDPNSIDVVIGGPPCQSFSTAGRRGTTQDPRGTLLWDFLRFVDYVKPKMFLMENVRGLLSAALLHRPIAERPDKGGTPLTPEEEPGSVVRLFAQDLAHLEGIGYHLDVFEVNSVNYGAPQIRERVLFIGNCFGRQVDFPQPTHGNPTSQTTAPGQLSLFEEQQLLPWKTLEDAIRDLDESDPEILDFSPRKKKYLAMVPPGSNWRSLSVDIQKESMGKAWYAKGGRSGWWRRLTFDLPSPTLVTMPNHASTSLCHPTQTRALSLREYARIQEFPDDWEFSGTTIQKYAQVGNAVPIRLGKVAGEVIASELDAIYGCGLVPLQCATTDPRIVYLQSHVRTRQWYKDGETLIWADGKYNENVCYAPPKTTKSVRGI